MNQQRYYNPEQAFHDKRVMSEMERFYLKEQNKLNHIMETPKVTKKLVEEYIAYILGVRVAVKFVRVSDTPQGAVWRHACLQTGVALVEPKIINLYGVPIKFIACDKCLTIVYEFNENI